MVFFPNIVVHKIMVQFIISNVLDLMKCGNICLTNLLVVVRTKSDMFARTLHLFKLYKLASKSTFVPG